MPLNLIKIYPTLLDLLQFNEEQRRISLKRIFDRDIENNDNLRLKTKRVNPIKIDGQPNLEMLFHHLTTKDDLDSKGKKLGSRSFELNRSQRLHWIRFHIEENKTENVEIFSFVDRIAGKNRIRTYIYDIEQCYVIILEPYRSGLEYYLLTAYYLNEPGGRNQIDKKLNKKLDELY